MIEIKNITKIYPGQEAPALKDVSLNIESGEFFGLLGPNGAGKTTMIKLLSTLLIPNEGQIIVDGEALSRNSSNVKKKLSMVTQEYSLRSNMTPEQIMELHGRLYQLPKNVIKERSEQLLDFCGFLLQTLCFHPGRLHLLALLLQLGQNIFKILVAFANKVVRFLQNILRQTQFP